MPVKNGKKMPYPNSTKKKPIKKKGKK